MFKGINAIEFGKRFYDWKARLNTHKDDYDDQCEILEINKGKTIQLEPDNTDMY